MGLWNCLRELFGRKHSAEDEDRFYHKYYAHTGVPKEIPTRLRRVFVDKIYGYWAGRDLTPSSNPVNDEIDLYEVICEVEEAFGVAISEKDRDTLDGSLDGFVRYLAARWNK